jgi:hypothetical protein
LSGAGDRIEVRSYRSVFALERRLYRIDRLRLNPAGVPVLGIVYFAGLLLVLAVAGALPVFGWLLHQLPWLGRLVVVPGAGAALLAVVRIDGRPFHLAALSLARAAMAPRHSCGLRACVPVGSRWPAPSLVLVADGSAPKPRRVRYRGPGAVSVRGAWRCTRWRRGALGRLLRRPDLVAVPVRRAPGTRAGGEHILSLSAGALLEIRRAPGS